MTSPSNPESRRHGAAWAAAALAIAAVLLFVAARWVLTPHAFGDTGASISSPLAQGKTEYFGMALYADAGDVPDITMSSAADGDAVQVGGPTESPQHAVTVNIVNAQPNVVENSSDAHLSLLYCVHRTKNLGMGSGFADTLHQICRSAQPFVPGTYFFDDDRDVVLAVTRAKLAQCMSTE